MAVFLFDLDGTLVDSRLDIASSANAVRAAMGLPPRPLEEISGFIGEGARRLLERTLAPEPADLDAAVARWKVEYARRLLDTTRVFPGLIAALDRLEGPKAVVTNKPGAFARRIVEALGLAGHFPVVLGPDDVGARKPEPVMVREALRRLGCDGPQASPAVLVGDSGIDAETARAAGIAFVGVLWGLRPREEMEAAGGRFFVEAPHQVAAICEAALRDGRF